MADQDAPNLDRLVDELQEMILADARAHYAPQVVEEWLAPKNMGPLSQPDVSAALRGGCGDTMHFYVQVQDDALAQVTFTTDGCGLTIACGSMLTRMVTGLSLSEARQVTTESLEQRLGGLPEESTHCAQLAIETLRRAIDNYGHRNDTLSFMPSSVEGMIALDENTQHAVAHRAADLMQQGYN